MQALRDFIRPVLLGCVTAALLGVASPARSANMIDITSPGTGQDWRFSVAASFYAYSAYTQGLAENATWMGPILVSLNGGTPFDAFCVDPFTDLAPVSDTTIGTPADLTDYGRIAWLIGTQFNLATTTPDEGAALSLAIWDLAADGGDGFSAGLVQATSAWPGDPILSLANGYLAASIGQTGTAILYMNTDAADGSRSQWLMAPVPEPASLGLFAGGLALLGMVRRRRRDQTASAATPGRVLPSSHSRKAPPALET